MKFKNIRDAYRRNKVKKSGQAAKKKYIYSELLSFLNPILELRKTDASNIAGENTTDNINENTQDSDEENVDDPPAIIVEQSTTPTDERQKTENLPVKRKKNSQSQLENDLSGYLNIMSKRMAETPKSAEKNDDNDDMQFFKSLIPLVRNISPEKKIVFRMAVMSAVQNAIQPSLTPVNIHSRPRSPLLHHRTYPHSPMFMSQNSDTTSPSLSSHSLSPPPPPPPLPRHTASFTSLTPSHSTHHDPTYDPSQYSPVVDRPPRDSESNFASWHNL